MSILYKDPIEVRAFAMDFSNFAELAAGDSISSVTSLTVAPNGPTLGTSSISGAQVKFTIMGGTAGSTYTVSCQITTSSGATLKGIGTLVIIPAQG